jgi:catechol 2,3-dioxygenase-like lactoylglutathione lyase family enzyme
MARRAGAILAVTDVGRSLAFYRDPLGFELEASYEDPPYVTLTLAGARLSLEPAESGGAGSAGAGATL